MSTEARREGLEGDISLDFSAVGRPNNAAKFVKPATRDTDCGTDRRPLVMPCPEDIPSVSTASIPPGNVTLKRKPVPDPARYSRGEYKTLPTSFAFDETSTTSPSPTPVRREVKPLWKIWRLEVVFILLSLSAFTGKLVCSLCSYSNCPSRYSYMDFMIRSHCRRSPELRPEALAGLAT